MRLVRNQTNDGTCKYALIRLDKMRQDGSLTSKQQLLDAAGALSNYIEFGEPGTAEEFFCVKLKDIHSTPALKSYADSVAAIGHDVEYKNDVLELKERSGQHSVFCKKPDILEHNDDSKSTQSMSNTSSNYYVKSLFCLTYIFANLAFFTLIIDPQLQDIAPISDWSFSAQIAHWAALLSMYAILCFLVTMGVGNSKKAWHKKLDLIFSKRQTTITLMIISIIIMLLLINWTSFLPADMQIKSSL